MNAVKPVSRAGHARNVIFLTADAPGVLPPVSVLTTEQTQYHFLSGYTSKIAGTERGVTDPQPTFSACFGAAFLSLHPTIYARELARKMEQHDTEAYLVNTGWIGGPYGIGSRIDIGVTRAMVRAILDGSVRNAGQVILPIFRLSIPVDIPGVDNRLLNPRSLWKNPAE